MFALSIHPYCFLINLIRNWSVKLQTIFAEKKMQLFF